MQYPDEYALPEMKVDQARYAESNFKVVEAMEIAKPGGGFISGSSDSFREGTPPQNMHAYFQACPQYGAYR